LIPLGFVSVTKFPHSDLENSPSYIDYFVFPDGNEKEVGQAIKDSGIDRQSLFVTTKL
jgi:hypothetical protein